MPAIMDFAGVEYEEVDFDSSSDIEGVNTDICGMMIIAEKGPISKPVRLTTFEQAKNIFGNYIDGAYGMYAIDGYFKNGGRVLWVSRLAHYDDITDNTTCMAKMATSEALGLPTYKSLGVLSTDKVVTGYYTKEGNDYVLVTGGTNATGTTEYFEKVDAEVTLTIKDKYLCSLGNKHGYEIVHKPSTTTKTLNACEKDATAIDGLVVRYFDNNDWLKIISKDDENVYEYVKVDYVETATRTIHLVEPLKNDYPVGSQIESTDFIFRTYHKSTVGNALEAEFVVNMDSKSPKYICAVVNSPSTGTALIDIEDEHINDELPYLKIPAETNGVVYLTGGDDGLRDFNDLDIIGDKAAKTGIYAFDAVTGMIHIACPESASRLVLKNGYDYCEARKTGIYMGHVASGLNPQATADFRDECGFNTSYGTLYHNWGYVTDPIGVGDEPEKLIPLIGHVMGCMAKRDRTDIDSYGAAPAGERCVLLGINRLEFSVDSSNGGVMYGDNNRSVNPIVNLSNNGGIAIWGARTLSSNKKWRQLKTRRIFIYTELSIVLGTRWACFRNKDESLYLQMNRVVNKFLSKVKGLYGKTNDEKFEFVCSEAINDPDDNYLISRVGLRPSAVAEFIFFEFGHKPDSVSLAEI